MGAVPSGTDPKAPSKAAPQGGHQQFLPEGGDDLGLLMAVGAATLRTRFPAASDILGHVPGPKHDPAAGTCLRSWDTLCCRDLSPAECWSKKTLPLGCLQALARARLQLINQLRQNQNSSQVRC